MTARKKPVPDALHDEMRPQPFPVVGLVCYATNSDLHELQKALDEEGALAVMQRLLRADHGAISEAAKFCLMNVADNTPWTGDVDTLPISTMELGQILADAVHRRLFGRKLQLEVQA